MDILTTAGGSRTISFLFYKLSIGEFFVFVIKKLCFYIDFIKYMGHNAETVIIVDHNNCGFWPTFDSIAIEDEEHEKSLRKAGKEIKKRFGKQIKEIILLYVITNKQHEVIKIRTVSF